GHGPELRALRRLGRRVHRPLHGRRHGRGRQPAGARGARRGVRSAATRERREPAMWNSFRTDQHLGMVAEITTYTAGGGDLIHAYVARPIGEGPFPGVVLLHHMPGWDEFYFEFTRRFAHHGYNAICPDLYCRAGHGSPDDITAKIRAEGGVADDSVVADSEA